MTSLRDQRHDTALISKGVSGEPVYRMTRELLAQINLGRDLLDFGAGTGHLATQIINEGSQVTITCADIQSRPAQLPPSIHWLQADLNEPLPFADASFDTIISNEVLPSLENPRFIFREFHRLLRPGGTLLLTQPNQESIRSLTALITRGHYAAFPGAIYPGHITPVLHEDFRRLCESSGFAPPVFYYTNDGNLPKIQSFRWQTLSLGLLKGRLFSDNMALLTTKK